MPDIGKNIKRIRKEKGVSQKELAERLGTSPQNLAQYENGKRTPKIDTLRKIASALQCQVSDIDESIIIIPKYKPTPEKMEQLRLEAEVMRIYEKIASGKTITSEEQQKIDTYAARRKAKYRQDEENNDSLSYENSHSYASSGEEFNKLQKEHEIESKREKASPYKDSDIYIDPDLQKLYETAMQKAIQHEELTEEEQQVIIGIPGQLRQKGDSYEDSYSFAGSEEELNRILKQRQKQREEALLTDYRKLNNVGQTEARKRVSELTEIPRYTEPYYPDTPQE